LLIDNTLASPYLCRPLEHGADIAVHSTTKYIDGHGTSVGGVIVDSSNFNWTAEKYPEMCTPDSSCHGLIYAEKFGKLACIVKANHGLTTLHLRMELHSVNALALAEYLEKLSSVSLVSYPGLNSHRS